MTHPVIDLIMSTKTSQRHGRYHPRVVYVGAWWWKSENGKLELFERTAWLYQPIRFLLFHETVQASSWSFGENTLQGATSECWIPAASSLAGSVVVSYGSWATYNIRCWVLYIGLQDLNLRQRHWIRWAHRFSGRSRRPTSPPANREFHTTRIQPQATRSSHRIRTRSGDFAVAMPVGKYLSFNTGEIESLDEAVAVSWSPTFWPQSLRTVIVFLIGEISPCRYFFVFWIQPFSFTKHLPAQQSILCSTNTTASPWWVLVHFLRKPLGSVEQLQQSRVLRFLDEYKTRNQNCLLIRETERLKFNHASSRSRLTCRDGKRIPLRTREKESLGGLILVNHIMARMVGLSCWVLRSQRQKLGKILLLKPKDIHTMVASIICWVISRWRATLWRSRYIWSIVRHCPFGHLEVKAEWRPAGSFPKVR